MSDIERLAQHLHEWDKRHRTRRQRLALAMKPWLQRPAVVASIAFLLGVVLTAGLLALFPGGGTGPSDPVYTPFTQVPKPTRPPHPASIYTPPGR